MPPQFAVYRNLNARTRKAFPFVVDVQTEVLENLRTRAVIPLVPLSGEAEVTRFPLVHLTPIVTFGGRGYLLMTPQLAGISCAELGPHAGSLADQRRLITSALDFLLSGC